MNLREVETLVDLVHVARVSEVTIRAHGRRITIRKDPNSAPPKHAPIEVAPSPALPSVETVAAAADAPHAAGAVIAAPMVGVFHSAEPAFGVGSQVEPGQVVGVIESMRLMNDVSAEIAGVIEAILVEDGMAVEYGQPIFRVHTASADASQAGE